MVLVSEADMISIYIYIYIYRYSSIYPSGLVCLPLLLGPEQDSKKAKKIGKQKRSRHISAPRGSQKLTSSAVILFFRAAFDRRGPGGQFDPFCRNRAKKNIVARSMVKKKYCCKKYGRQEIML